MRVAILVDELPTSSAPKIVGEEAFHLNELGVRCDVYVLKHRDNEIAPPHIEQIILIHLDADLGSMARAFGWRIPTFSFFSLYHITYPYILSNRASRVLDRYDVIIAHYASTAIFTSKLRLKNAKMIFYYWDPISYIFENAYAESWSSVRRKILSYLAKAFDKKLLSNADLIALPSKFHYKRIKSLAPDKPVKIIYPGTDIADKIPSNRGDYILSVARWERGKNPFFLIDLAEILAKELNEFKIYMVGPWRPATLLKEFMLKAKRGGVINRFRIVGPKYGDDLRNLYLRARCLVHTKVEAFGFTGLEAAAHGCPIVFPSGSGVTELFTHGVHGYFPKEGEATEYAKYIARLVGDEALSYKMGYEAWKIAKQFTWKKHAENLLKIL